MATSKQPSNTRIPEEKEPMVEFRIPERDDNGVLQQKVYRIPESEREAFEIENGLR